MLSHAVITIVQHVTNQSHLVPIHQGYKKTSDQLSSAVSLSRTGRPVPSAADAAAAHSDCTGRGVKGDPGHLRRGSDDRRDGCAAVQGPRRTSVRAEGRIASAG